MMRKASFFERCYLKKGFTFLELLVILAVIAILVAVAANVFFSGTTDEAKATKLQDYVKSTEQAIQRFKFDVGDYPSQTKYLWNGTDSSGNAIPNWAGPYLHPYLADDSGNIILKDIGSDTKLKVVCTDGDKVELEVDNVPKSVAVAYDKKFDDGDLTKGNVVYDSTNKKMTVKITDSSLETITCY
jgi:prepilin-type N-terminal cleavage/methylation domain-containing protein